MLDEGLITEDISSILSFKLIEKMRLSESCPNIPNITHLSHLTQTYQTSQTKRKEKT